MAGYFLPRHIDKKIEKLNAGHNHSIPIDILRSVDLYLKAFVVFRKISYVTLVLLSLCCPRLKYFRSKVSPQTLQQKSHPNGNKRAY